MVMKAGGLGESISKFQQNKVVQSNGSWNLQANKVLQNVHNT